MAAASGKCLLVTGPPVCIGSLYHSVWELYLFDENTSRLIRVFVRVLGRRR